MSESLAALYATLVSRPDCYGGRPMLPGTGIPVWILAELVQTGESLEDCLRAYPSLSRDQWLHFSPLLEQFPATPPPLP